jgi:hypothetical protein
MFHILSLGTATPRTKSKILNPEGMVDLRKCVDVAAKSRNSAHEGNRN